MNLTCQSGPAMIALRIRCDIFWRMKIGQEDILIALLIRCLEYDIF